MRTTTTILSGLLLINMAVTAMLYYKYYPGADTDDMAQTNAEIAAGRNREQSQTTNHGGEFKAENYGAVFITVNGLAVRQLELLPYLGEVMPPAQFQSLKNFDDIPEIFLTQATQSIAIDILLEDEASRAGLNTDPGIQAAILQYSRRYVRAAYLNSLSPTLVSAEDVKKTYDSLATGLNGKHEYHARHILLATEKQAHIISEALAKNKQPFAELAKMHSIDNTSNYKGGDLGFNIEGSLQQQFEAAISKLPLKQYSRPFKTDLGWHIAIVDERRASAPLPYEQAAAAIRVNLEQQAINAYVEKMLSSADIRVHAFDADEDAMATEPLADH